MFRISFFFYRGKEFIENRYHSKSDVSFDESKLLAYRARTNLYTRSVPEWEHDYQANYMLGIDDGFSTFSFMPANNTVQTSAGVIGIDKKSKYVYIHIHIYVYIEEGVILQDWRDIG